MKREQTGNLVDEIRTKFREQKIGYRGLAVSDGKKPYFPCAKTSSSPAPTCAKKA